MTSSIDDRYRLLVFDWDGTLMDSEAHIVDCMVAATDAMGLEQLPREQLRNIIGLGMREAINSLFPQQQQQGFVEEFASCYRQFFFSPDAEQSLFAGVETLLQQLRDKGYLLAVATGKSRRGLDLVLDETGLGNLFHASRCADETRSKPHPQMLMEIMDTLGMQPEETVMIGDTVYDLEMAHNAGCTSIAVTYGVHDEERLEAYGPLAMVSAISELDEVLMQLSRPAA